MAYLIQEIGKQIRICVEACVLLLNRNLQKPLMLINLT